MAQELFYTSATYGIHGKANGFTTVARTKAMSAALTEKRAPRFPSAHDAQPAG